MSTTKPQVGFDWKPKDFQQVLYLVVLLFGGVMAWANLNSTVQETVRALTRIESHLDKTDSKVDVLHDDGIRRDGQIQELTRELREMKKQISDQSPIK